MKIGELRQKLKRLEELEKEIQSIKFGYNGERRQLGPLAQAKIDTLEAEEKVLFDEVVKL